MKIIGLLTQRRIWAGLFASVAFIFPLFGVTYQVDTTTLTDLFTNLGLAIAGLSAAILPIISYFKPKQ